MKLSEYDLALLVHLTEECAEVQQVAMKAIRFGWDSYHPDDPEKTLNSVLLAREFGNMLMIADLLGLDPDEIQHGKEEKKRKIEAMGLMDNMESDDDRIHYG